MSVSGLVTFKSSNGAACWSGPGDSEMSIGEVALWTGYSHTTLARLDQEEKIVAAHRKGAMRFPDPEGMRSDDRWVARQPDILVIR